MNAVFEAYDLLVKDLVEFYQRINTTITYPDGMTTSLGIVYWGREQHFAGIERAIPELVDHGATKFSDVLQAAKTPARAKKLAERTGISKEILRILKHDIELWLPKSVPLRQIEWFRNNPDFLTALSRIGFENQLAVISAGQSPTLRENVTLKTGADISTMTEIVKQCDYYRTGKNLGHIRAKIYYEMGMDTWQKWAEQTSETIISTFTKYVQENHLEGERLIPWPKEVRNGIEWAKLHLEIYSVEW